MAKKKKPTPPKKKVTKAQKKAIVVAKNQVKKYERKLDEKRLPLEEKYILEKELKKHKRKAGIKGPTKKEKVRHKKEKASISSQKSVIKKKMLSGDISKKEYNKLRKKFITLNRRWNAINKNLGIKQKKKVTEPTKEKMGVVYQEVPVWEVRADYLEPLHDSSVMKHVIIEGKKFNIKRKWDDILMAWYELEMKALQDGGSTPRVRVGIDLENKTTSFDLM